MLTNQRNSLPEKKSRIISLAFLFYTNRGRERGKKGNERKKKEKRRDELFGLGPLKLKCLKTTQSLSAISFIHELEQSKMNGTAKYSQEIPRTVSVKQCWW